MFGDHLRALRLSRLNEDTQTHRFLQDTAPARIDEEIGTIGARFHFSEVIFATGRIAAIPSALVAIANKHARQLWAMLAHGETYDADAWLKHPMVQRPAGKHAITVAAMA